MKILDKIITTVLVIMATMGIVTSVVWFESDQAITEAAMYGDLPHVRALWNSNNLEARYFYAIHLMKHAAANTKLSSRDRYNFLKQADRIFTSIRKVAPNYWGVVRCGDAVKSDLENFHVD